jgi:hypothetical protein
MNQDMSYDSKGTGKQNKRERSIGERGGKKKTMRSQRECVPIVPIEDQKGNPNLGARG